MSIRTKGIMFLSQNITIDSAYLLEYSDIKQSLMNNKAEYLDGTNLIQNPKVQRLRPPPVTNEPISYKGRFTVWRSTMYIEHWIPVPGTNNKYFTDGSFNAEPSSPEFQMGYGWTTSNLQEFNWTHKGAVEYMPSSTKGHFDCFNRVSL
ncbi:ribonuclease H-like domain-containing protein [Rhizophagus irregularis DAOM 181602=DAOM 197198]|nr:ribonuclease H-like domain-containing protein [Rhizophagus irregularis DAOM 181602=DAOM 197198]